MMRLMMEQIQPEEETQVIIRYNKLDEQVTRLIHFIQSEAKFVIGYDQSTIELIKPHDVFYVESVDDKVFIYLQERVVESRQKLYEIEADFGSDLIFRSSKSSILNIAKIHSVRPLLGGRFEALLLNGEKVVISRQYVPVLKNKLGL